MDQQHYGHGCELLGERSEPEIRMRVDLGFRTEIAYAVTMLENGPTICSHQNGKAGRVGRSHSRENRINLFFDGRF